MKKSTKCFFILSLFLLCLCGCSQSSKLNPKSPVTLTMWHVYGEQADSPMNRLITEFNETVGKEKGIIINVTRMSNSKEIGPMLTSAFENAPGAPEIPDLFFGHNSNVAQIGAENVLNWNDLFTEEELEDFVSDFLKEGIVDDTLAVLPVSKSTQLLFVNGSEFDRFSAESGVTYEDFSTWEGLFDAAASYYAWSNGKPMCVFDYLLRAVELNMLAKDQEVLFTEDGWYDFDDPSLKESYLTFMRSLVQGHIAVADLYSNTQIMTGETMSGIGSCAALLYYNDIVTYPDNTTEPVNLQILPYPHTADQDGLMTQAGVGLCAYKTTEQKAEAASVFAHWLTEPERNLDFVTQTAYMPVRTGAFDAAADYEFTDENHEKLYTTLDTMRETYTAYPEEYASGYYDKVTILYEQLRKNQPEWILRSQNGESIDKLAEEAWEQFCQIK